MIFRAEEITDYDRIYIIRGYENEDDTRYVLLGFVVVDKDGNGEEKGVLTKSTISRSAVKTFFPFAGKLADKLEADVLIKDYSRFYKRLGFARVDLKHNNLGK